MDLGLENPVEHMVRLLDRESIALNHCFVEPAGAHAERKDFALKVMCTLQKHGLMVGRMIEDAIWSSALLKR
jgi:hypothetical protein